MKAADFVCDRHVMLHELRQLKESDINLLTEYADPEKRVRVWDTIIEMCREML